ncbi:hypothetical protein yinte0001_28540 [Yersinia intermedia ATCC 29909]|nr:hypothetical protein yinte0001_28540 [Yersinia intermedia ATCC 29909]
MVINGIINLVDHLDGEREQLTLLQHQELRYTREVGYVRIARDERKCSHGYLL